MTKAVLDDHLVRDLLADDMSDGLARMMADYEPATTNLFLYRLCKSVVSARGGALTGAWPAEERRALGARLLTLPETVEVVPMRELSYRMAEISDAHRVSTLGAEAAAAAEHLNAQLCVWEGDDGPGIRACCAALGVTYDTLAR